MANIVVEATGAAIASATLRGYRAENAGIQLVTPTASIRDMTDPSWALGATCTRARTSIGIDGVANTATRLTFGAVAATNIITQTLVAAASSRTYACYIKRITGTGPIRLTQDNFVGGTDISASLIANQWVRVQFNASILNAVYGIKGDTNLDAIDVDFNGFEAGEIATSPMDAAGAVRNADILTYPFLGNMDATKGTIYSEAQWDTATANGPARHIVATGSGAGGGPHQIQGSGAATSLSFRDGTNVVAAAGLASLGTAIRKSAVTYGGIVVSQTRDGAAVQSGVFDGALVSTIITIGNESGGPTIGFNGTIRNVHISLEPTGNLSALQY